MKVHEISSHFQQPSSSKDKSLVIKEPTYLEIFSLDKPINSSQFDFLTELQNICVNIPLLQAIKDIPFFTKTIREPCLKNIGRKLKDPPIIKVVG